MKSFRKIISLIMAAVLVISCLSIFSMSSFAAKTPQKIVGSLVLSAVNTTDNTITLTATIPTNSNLSGAKFVITYNSAMVELVSADASALGGFAYTNAASAGRYNIAWMISSGGLIDEKTITVNFKILDGACGESEFTFISDNKNTTLGDEMDPAYFTTTPVYLNLGVVSVEVGNNGYSFANENPKVIATYSDGHTGELRGYKLIGDFNSFMVKGKSYLFSGLSATPVTKGDYNGDGSFDANDYGMMKLAVMNENIYESSELELFKYDVYPDGTVDGFDLFYLNKMLNGYAS